MEFMTIFLIALVVLAVVFVKMAVVIIPQSFDNSANDWGYLYEVGTCANKDTNVHVHLCFLKFFYLSPVSLNNSFIPPRLPNMFVASNGRNTVFVLSPWASSSIILMYFWASR
jgi:hypothetical protein